MAESDPRPWFAPKRHGYGSGLPIAWQGWVTLALFLVITIGSQFVLPPYITPFVVIAATAVLIVVARRKTRGGWRWRSGGLDD